MSFQFYSENHDISISFLGGAYEIIDGSNLSSTDSHSFKNITGYSSPTWGTTYDFAGVNGASNHCGATAAFNVVNYYKTRYGRSSLFYNSSRTSTFIKLHEKIGNGPVTFIGLTRGLKSYVAERGSTYSEAIVDNYTGIKAQLKEK